MSVTKTRSLAIIPARGGSKRIPRKNIKLFGGEPAIKYSIDAALKAGCFDEVMVSTDDTEIAEISMKLGAKVPFLRSVNTSNDHAGLAEVALEVLAEYKKQATEYDNLCLILPTAIFLTPAKISKAYELLINNPEAEAVIPVVRFSYPIQRALQIDNSYLSMIWPENYSKRSQDLKSTYHDAGQFCWIKTGSLLKEKKFFVEKTLPLEIPESEVQDIDTEEDWKVAEIKYKMLKK